jgi:hypothetical protein
MYERMAYQENAKLAVWPLLGIAIALLLFYAVRFALTGRIHPLLCWRLP